MTSDRPLIGAAIIVKDEAAHLRRCLASIRDLCDEIVVVDTGSSDDSVAVAQEHGAVVLHRPWDGDFSAARNLGLDHISADWILYIDADEEAQQLDTPAVRTALATADGVINATPLGMDAHPGMAFPASLLRPGLWVAEVVYFPLETQLLREARAAGCRTVDGGGMAVFQAVEAFRLFSGVTPDAERMRRHFLSMD